VEAKKKQNETKPPEWSSDEEEVAEHDLFGSLDEEEVPHRNPSELPVDMLLGGAAFAKQYDVPGFFSLMAELIKTRLSSKNFDTVVAYAISKDMCFCARARWRDTGRETQRERETQR
jgi:hypothetical protein